MPLEYTCANCDLTVSVGSHHGWTPGSWWTDLYCRHCGSQYQLEENSSQFLDAFSVTKPRSDTRHYVLHGHGTGTGPQEVIVKPGDPVPTVRCGHCGAEGPFGSSGPITDRPPEGIPGGGGSPADDERHVAGVCPRCGQREVRFSAQWID